MPRPRAQIDAAALADAFAEGGLAGTSSARLATALGVAKPTLYAHGGSKAALFELAVVTEVERVLGALQAADTRAAGLSARARATAAALALLEHAAQRPGGARLLRRAALEDGPAAAAVARIPDRLADGLRRDLTADGLDAALAPFLARGVHGAALALAEVRPGERRPTRARLAALAARVVPERPSLPPEAWPAA